MTTLITAAKETIRHQEALLSNMTCSGDVKMTRPVSYISCWYFDDHFVKPTYVSWS